MLSSVFKFIKVFISIVLLLISIQNCAHHSKQKTSLDNSKKVNELLKEQENLKKQLADLRKDTETALMTLYNQISKLNAHLGIEDANFTATNLIPEKSDENITISGIKAKFPSAEQLFSEAKGLAEKGNCADAIVLYEEFVARFENNPSAREANFRIGECFYLLKDFNSAVEIFEKLIEKPEKDKWRELALLYSGFSCYDLDLIARAMQYFDKVIQEFPQSDSAIKAKEMKVKIVKKM